PPAPAGGGGGGAAGRPRAASAPRNLSVSTLPGPSSGTLSTNRPATSPMCSNSGLTGGVDASVLAGLAKDTCFAASGGGGGGGEARGVQRGGTRATGGRDAATAVMFLPSLPSLLLPLPPALDSPPHGAETDSSGHRRGLFPPRGPPTFPSPAGSTQPGLADCRNTPEGTGSFRPPSKEGGPLEIHANALGGPSPTIDALGSCGNPTLSNTSTSRDLSRGVTLSLEKDRAFCSSKGPWSSIASRSPRYCSTAGYCTGFVLAVAGGMHMQGRGPLCYPSSSAFKQGQTKVKRTFCVLLRHTFAPFFGARGAETVQQDPMEFDVYAHRPPVNPPGPEEAVAYLGDFFSPGVIAV
ncbi:hypothetical protein THAOC_26698, partial [Thalassiosira oceanica]